MDAMTDGDDRATGRWVASKVRDAINAVKSIATTGRPDLDADLLLAEQALRRVKVAADADPN